MTGPIAKAFPLLLAAGSCVADIYMHNPRGSNNRLNENTANRRNGNRCFDSQNNNKGGYNVGDRYSTAANGNTIKQIVQDQYQMEYQLGSVLEVEWTNQHGCGGNHFDDEQKTDCNLVFQVMCLGKNEFENDELTEESARNAANDGATTQRPEVTRSDETDPATCQFENTAMYHFCQKRQRNKGLFTADQKLKGNDATKTRQNPNGNRRGLECPEERDYFPYWAPTQWIDLAYITSNPMQCEAAMLKSQNLLKNRASWCLKMDAGAQKNFWEIRDTDFCSSPEHDNLAPHDQAGCETAGCQWVRPVNLLPYDTSNGGKNLNEVDVFAPVCLDAPKSRPNQLGNTPDGEASRIKIQLPGKDIFGAAIGMQCQFRLRYNISTFDYEAMNDDLDAVVDHTYNNNPVQDVYSPVRQNPTVRYDQTPNMKSTTQGFKLAINTAQFGRTFQDRSHVFRFVDEPSAVSGTVYNLNVRGKRGNIVQTYPAVEYDFVPNRLWLCENDAAHIQWTGSNTHNNRAPAGDGQAGDAGEGTGGTDRSNMVGVTDRAVNYPAYNQNMWNKACADMSSPDDCKALKWDVMTGCHISNGARYSAEGRENNPLLNSSPASCNIATPVSFNEGIHHYMGTRNNNFSNRSQKGSINQVTGQCKPQLTPCYCCSKDVAGKEQCENVAMLINSAREYPSGWKDDDRYCRGPECAGSSSGGWRETPQGDLSK